MFLFPQTPLKIVCSYSTSRIPFKHSLDRNDKARIMRRTHGINPGSFGVSPCRVFPEEEHIDLSVTNHAKYLQTQRERPQLGGSRIPFKHPLDRNDKARGYSAAHTWYQPRLKCERAPAGALLRRGTHRFVCNKSRESRPKRRDLNWEANEKVQQITRKQTQKERPQLGSQ